MFKKSLSVVLSIFMILSCMTTLITPAVAVETPTGTPITSLDQITNFSGSYYLEADIGSESSPNTTTLAGKYFAGTLDGNGYSIWTSVPLFDKLSTATFKNLTTRGTVKSTARYIGVIANRSEGTITLTNCKNYADIVHVIPNTYEQIVGGFVGYFYTGKGNSFTDCENHGDITVSLAEGTAYSASIMVGGLVGYAYCKETEAYDTTTTFTNCKNYGNITENSNNKLMCGGLVGTSKFWENYKFVGCENYGALVTNNSGKEVYIGGIAGNMSYTNGQNTYEGCTNAGAISGYGVFGGIVGLDEGTASFSNCVNAETGTITHTIFTYPTAGGILGRSSATHNATFVKCVNNAPITGSYRIGGIVAELRSGATAIGCKNTGPITLHENSNQHPEVGGIIGSHSGTGALTVADSENAGQIDNKTTAAKNYMIGGILGAGYSNSVNRMFVNCVNNGDILAVAGGSYSRAGGMTTQVKGTTTFYGCVNTGDLTAFWHTSGIVNVSDGNAKLIACVNRGELTAPSTAAGSTIVAGLVSSVSSGYTASLYSCVNTGTLTNNRNAANVVDLCPTGSIKENKFSDMGDTDAAVEFEGVQRSIKVEGEETFSIRFVTAISDIENYVSTGILVYVNELESADVKYAQRDTDTVYTQIGGVENGVNVTYPVAPVEGKYFTALTVDGISTTGTFSFVIVPYTVAVEDAPAVYGDACTVKVVDGEITDVSWLVDPAN